MARASAERLISPAVSGAEDDLIDFIENCLSGVRPDHTRSLREGISVIMRSMEQGDLSKEGADRLVEMLLAMYLENAIAEQVWNYFHLSPIASQRRDSHFDRG